MKNAPNLDLYLLARQWGASALPFGELTPEAWLDTPQTQRACALLDQTATLRSVMLLAGPNGVGKSALLGRWVQSLDRRLFHPLVLTHATLSGSNLLSTLTRKLGQPAVCRRDTNLALIESALAQLDRVGLQREVFEPAALALLTSASAGLPRSLCLLARTAWIHAASLGVQRIQPDHVQHAIDTVPGAVSLAPQPQPEPVA